MKRILLSVGLIVVPVMQVHAGDASFNFPKNSADMNPGQYVLCPPRAWIDGAMKKGLDRQTFIFYAATLETPGPGDSVITTLSGRESTIPNSLIVPLRKGGTAQPGDIVLTWWQTGSGMQRAIVVGGTKTEPVVRYLDIKYDNPIGAAKKDSVLKPDSFHVLEPMQPGTAVMVNKRGRVRHGQLINADDKNVLLMEFGGKLAVYPKSQATGIPLRVRVSPGDRVYVPVFGSMAPATVKKVDEKIGRVFAEYKFAGKSKGNAFAFGDVALKLP